MDTNWCSFCDKAVSPFSDSLYCSDECLRKDALQNHPMLGYNFSEYRGFLSNERDHHYHQTSIPSSSAYSEDESASPTSCCGPAPSLSSSVASSSYLSVKSSFAIAAGPTTTTTTTTTTTPPPSHHDFTMARKHLQYISARPAAVNSLYPSS